MSYNQAESNILDGYMTLLAGSQDRRRVHRWFDARPYPSKCRNDADDSDVGIDDQQQYWYSRARLQHKVISSLG